MNSLLTQHWNVNLQRVERKIFFIKDGKMTLNIKDPEVYELAQRIAEETGETMTRAVKEALREKLDRIRRKKKPHAIAEDLLAIGTRCAATLKGRPVDHGVLLYDERGLPR